MQDSGDKYSQKDHPLLFAVELAVDDDDMIRYREMRYDSVTGGVAAWLVMRKIDDRRAGTD